MMAGGLTLLIKRTTMQTNRAMPSTPVRDKASSGDPAQILFLTTPKTGSRSAAVRQFLESIGSQPPVTSSIGDFPLERQAAEWAFGTNGLPRYDLCNARYALSVGADFLGGFNGSGVGTFNTQTINRGTVRSEVGVLSMRGSTIRNVTTISIDSDSVLSGFTRELSFQPLGTN